MTVRLVSKLELRRVPIPRSWLIESLERTMGRPLTHETRHYLAGRPVQCGDALQVYLDGAWVNGRYEWTGQPDELPTFEFDDGVLRIDDNCLVRWPLKWT